MELLKNILIKEIRNGRDMVAFVDNLPKSLLYKQSMKLMIDYTNPQQNMVPEFTVDERGRKIPTGATVDELREGIELSQTGDGAYVFFTDYNEAKTCLAAIDRYIQQNMPQTDRIPARVPYAQQPGVLSSGPRSLSDIPRVVLPEPFSPPATAVKDSGALSSDSAPTEVAPKKRVWTDEQKKAAADRLAKAREAKKAKA